MCFTFRYYEANRDALGKKKDVKDLYADVLSKLLLCKLFSVIVKVK